MKRKYTYLAAALLILATASLLSACGLKATTMNLARAEGSVDILDASLKSIEPAEDLKLYSGYQMSTQQFSYAWINLDNVKLAKMDQASDVQIQKEGKDLTLLLNAGSLYFNVSEPLKEDETMSIRSSSMAVGIRGTSGWVETPAPGRMLVHILEGTVQCLVADPASGQSQSASVSAGQTAVMTVADGQVSLTVSQFRESDIPSFVKAELTEEDLVAFRPNLAPGGSDRPMLIPTGADYTEVSVEASVGTYTVEPDLSNIDNLWQIYMEEGQAQKFAQNGFVVAGSAGSEFFEIYESNRYAQIPSFVTVDSLMHTYHLYFAHLLKNIERDYLADKLTQLSRQMLELSTLQYSQLQGSEWETAARRNVAYFTIGARLLDDSVTVNDYVSDVVWQEIEKIGAAQGIQDCAITGKFEDYSQYIPRGYYEGDPRLEQYFRAMMWYGRIHFTQDEEDLDRSALLITQALYDSPDSLSLWESIYAVTSFFAGASDDAGVCEYIGVIRAAYGEDLSVQGLIGTPDAFQAYHTQTATLMVPQINSLPVWEGEETVIPGFRFMGQRFSIDAAIMQRLIYSNVGANSAGENRMLPDVLDVPAVLGSDTALNILEANGATGYAGYSENMSRMRQDMAMENSTLWTASLYANWLNTLRPLLTPKAEGYPPFMQNEEWLKKNLECFAGSFTELKHDTVLYSKQVMAEMGGGADDHPEPDDRGYVEPEPLVYERFVRLADLTAQGLAQYGMLSETDQENLSRLSYLAGQLLVISQKELREESLTAEEYELIKTYGGNLEHFWRESVKEQNDSDWLNTQEYPAAIVVDIATDPNGQVLEAATGNPSSIFVAVQVEGKLKIARGSVFTFYQFPWPMSDRLTDSKWRQMMGLQVGDDGHYNYDRPVKQPEWTDSYRYRYTWE